MQVHNTLLLLLQTLGAPLSCCSSSYHRPLHFCYMFKVEDGGATIAVATELVTQTVCSHTARARAHQSNLQMMIQQMTHTHRETLHEPIDFAASAQENGQLSSFYCGHSLLFRISSSYLSAKLHFVVNLLDVFSLYRNF